MAGPCVIGGTRKGGGLEQDTPNARCGLQQPLQRTETEAPGRHPERRKGDEPNRHAGAPATGPPRAHAPGQRPRTGRPALNLLALLPLATLVAVPTSRAVAQGRSSLVMAALSNLRLEAVYQRLVANGKKRLAASTAVLRELVTITNAKLRDALANQAAQLS